MHETSSISAAPREYPDSLQGGEPQDLEHRVGETQPQGPEIGNVDPANAQPDSQGSEGKGSGREKPKPADTSKGDPGGRE